MDKIHIKSISINGFRGINNERNPLVIPFNTAGVTSIFAENGIGKSSVFEALYYCINGYLPKFDTLHREIRDDKAKKNLFHSSIGVIKIVFIDSADREITIDFEISEQGDRRISNSNISNPQGFLDRIRCEHNFLDYHSFTQIITKSPEEAGKLFSDLVGYQEFPDLREKIDKITRTQNINSDFQKNQNEQNIKANEEFVANSQILILKNLNDLGFDIKVFDSKEIITLIKRLIKKEFRTDIKDITSIQFDQLVRNRAGISYDRDVEELNNLQTKRHDIVKFKNNLSALPKVKLSKIIKDLEKSYLELGSATELYINELFEKAILAYDNIPDFDKNNCILCKSQGINTNNRFYDLINVQIKNFLHFKNEIKKITELFKTFIQDFNLIEIEKYLVDIRYIENNNKAFTKVFYSSSDLDFNRREDFKKIIDCYSLEIKKKIKSINDEIKILASKVPKGLPELIQKSLKIKDIVDNLILIEEKQVKIKSSVKYLLELNRWVGFATNLRDEFEKAFNDLMSDISSDIGIQTKEYFSLIMKNKEISPLIKKDSKGQKINILLDKFYSIHKEHNATPLLSESYRNALCLSIYFASALKNNSRGNFIILDDITSSFDSGHQFFLLDLIKDKISSIVNKKGKQIILLTHDGLLKKTINGFKASNKNWVHYSLWGNKDELSLKAFGVEDYKRLLMEKIKNGDSIGSDLRAYYEFVLMDIIEKFDLPLPVSLLQNPDKKLIDPLLAAIIEIIELKRKSKKRILTNLPNRSDLKIYVQQMGNNLAHFNSSSSSSLSSSVLIGFVDAIENLQQRFQYQCICALKHGWVYYKTLSGGKRNTECKCNL